MPVQPRYLEVDAQGVVFHMWYLAYFDEALPRFLASRGLDYPTMLDSGVDLAVVRTEVDWRAGLTWGDEAEVTVLPVRLGRTSLVLQFDVVRAGRVAVTARTTYVAIGTEGSGKRELPDRMRTALHDAAGS
jgi:acyl-CoA thioester hydrolase